jgi:hypothetical protein
MSSIQQETLVVYRGDDWGMQLHFNNPDGTPIDITLWTLFFTIKRRKTDSDADAVIRKTTTSFSDPVNGIGSIILTNVETYNLNGLYYYDFQFKDQNDIVQTIVSGGISFEFDITRRTT